MQRFITPRGLAKAFLIAFYLPTLAAAQTFDMSSQSADVRKGLAALALYDRSGKLEDATQAARAFSAAIRANENDPWAHYGLGATLYRAKKTMATVRARGIADGEAIRVAQRELERALDLQPDFTLAAELLALIAERGGDTKALARARDVLSKSSESGESVGRLDLALGDTAAVMARTPVTATDHLRRAMVLFARDEEAAGADAYFAGLENWDEGSADNFTHDVLPVATPEETNGLTTGLLPDRVAALRFFWHKRSVRDGVSVQDRIGEHYRRLAVARRDYRRHERRGPNGPGAITRGHPTGIASEIDDRGIMLLRYGEPFDRIRVSNALTRGNETWVYLLPDGSYENFRFAQLPGASGFQLVADPVAMLDVDYDKFISGGSRAWTELATDETFANATHFFEEHGRYDPRLRLIALRISSLHSQLKIGSRFWDETAQSLQMDNFRWYKGNEARALSALQRDAAPYVFDRPLLLFHDLATFRGDGCTDVIYTLAALASSYRVRVSISDTLNWQTSAMDEVVSMEVPTRGYLRSTGVLCAQPSDNGYIRFMVSSDSSTGTTAGGLIAIPDYSGTALMMSDMLFATSEDGPFVRGVARLALVPPRQFRQDAAFRMFYELYNLPTGRKYRTEITLTMIAANPFAKLLNRKKEVSLSFESEAGSGDVVQELRTIVAEIDPGEVEVKVEVTDLVTQETATKRETIWILPAQQ